jgi:sec-independent protein translocase protein TatA
VTFGLLELGILLFVVFLVLGPKRIQNLLGAVGRGVQDFTTEFTRDKSEEKKMLGRGDWDDRD